MGGRGPSCRAAKTGNTESLEGRCGAPLGTDTGRMSFLRHPRSQEIRPGCRTAWSASRTALCLRPSRPGVHGVRGGEVCQDSSPGTPPAGAGQCLCATFLQTHTKPSRSVLRGGRGVTAPRLPAGGRSETLGEGLAPPHLEGSPGAPSTPLRSARERSGPDGWPPSLSPSG